MQTLTAGYRGVSLLIDLNWDRLLYIGTLFAALLFGAWLGSMF
jgi:hypothetical protein